MNIAQIKDRFFMVLFGTLSFFMLLWAVFFENWIVVLSIPYLMLFYAFVNFNKKSHFAVGMIFFLILSYIFVEETIQTEACLVTIISFCLFIASLFNKNTSGWRKYIPLVGVLVVLGNVFYFAHVMGKIG